MIKWIKSLFWHKKPMQKKVLEKIHIKKKFKKGKKCQK